MRLACKIFDKEKAPDDFLDKFFPRELEILTKIENPHIIQVRITRKISVHLVIDKRGTILVEIHVTYFFSFLSKLTKIKNLQSAILSQTSKHSLHHYFTIQMNKIELNGIENNFKHDREEILGTLL